jgi:hypothetical protein
VASRLWGALSQPGLSWARRQPRDDALFSPAPAVEEALVSLARACQMKIPAEAGGEDRDRAGAVRVPYFSLIVRLISVPQLSQT